VQLAASWASMKDSKVFSLRKTNEVVNVVNHFENTTTHSVAFDHYGTNLLCGSGNGLNIHGGKSLSEPIHSVIAHDGIVNIAKFSPSGSLIVSGGEDRFLKIHSLWD